MLLFYYNRFKNRRFLNEQFKPTRTLEYITIKVLRLYKKKS